MGLPEFIHRLKNSVLVRGSAILLASNLIVRGLDYLFQVIMGRALGPQEYGILSLVIPVQFMIIMLASIGIAPSIARFTARHIGMNEHHKLGELYSSVVFYYVLAGLIFGGFVFLVSDWLAYSFFKVPELAIIFKITAIGVPFGIFVSVFTGFFQGFKEMHRMSYAVIAQQAFRLVLATTFVVIGLKALGAALGSTIAFLCAVIFAYFLFRKYNIRYTKANFKVFWEVFKFSIPTSISGLSTIILAYTDIFMIGRFMTPASVGLYAAASPTARLCIAVAIAVSTTILPIIAEKKAKDPTHQIKRHTYNSLKIFFAAGIPLVTALYFVAPWVITVLFGPEYVAAKMAFRILLVSSFFMSIHIVLSGSFQGIGKPHIPMYVVSSIALLNIPLNYLLIPLYGIEGAAIATAICSTIGGLSSLAIFVSLRDKL